MYTVPREGSPRPQLHGWGWCILLIALTSISYFAIPTIACLLGFRPWLGVNSIYPDLDYWLKGLGGGMLSAILVARLWSRLPPWVRGLGLAAPLTMGAIYVASALML